MKILKSNGYKSFYKKPVYFEAKTKIKKTNFRNKNTILKFKESKNSSSKSRKLFGNGLFPDILTGLRILAGVGAIAYGGQCVWEEFGSSDTVEFDGIY